MYGFMWLFNAWSFIDCLLFGAIISATDPGWFLVDQMMHLSVVIFLGADKMHLNH